MGPNAMILAQSQLLGGAFYRAWGLFNQEAWTTSLYEPASVTPFVRYVLFTLVMNYHLLLLLFIPCIHLYTPLKGTHLQAYLGKKDKRPKGEPVSTI